MSDDYAPFLANLTRILEKNGFPGKRVALPLEKMYEVAYGKGLNFNKALALLEERGVAHEKTNDKVIFLPKPAEDPFAANPAFAQAAEMMKGMSPEQLDQIRQMVESMSESERADLMQRARDMGILK